MRVPWRKKRKMTTMTSSRKQIVKITVAFGLLTRLKHNGQVFGLFELASLAVFSCYKTGLSFIFPAGVGCRILPPGRINLPCDLNTVHCSRQAACLHVPPPLLAVRACARNHKRRTGRGWS